jgi:SAM-dependent methyltransferase
MSIDTATDLPAYAMNRASFPEMYERCLVGPLFRPWAEVLIDQVRLAPGARVLDVACGTGIAARLARERVDGAVVVGVDLSRPMLEVARTIEPRIDWREGDAAALPVAVGEEFDAVLCHQGLQFFADRAAAAREMRRVLAPDGSLVAATWRHLEENPLFRDLQRIAEPHLGAIADGRFRLGEAAALHDLLAAAGLSDVRVQTLSRVLRFSDGLSFVRMNAMALVGMRATAVSLGDAERDRLLEVIVAESAGVMRSYGDGQSLVFEMSANVATARRRR